METTRNARGYISLRDAVRHPIVQAMYWEREMFNRFPLRPLFIDNLEGVVKAMYNRDQPRLKGVISK